MVAALTGSDNKGYWRHWDVYDPNGKKLGRVPKNCLKPWPNQKKLKKRMSQEDPNGDAEPFKPDEWPKDPLLPKKPTTDDPDCPVDDFIE